MRATIAIWRAAVTDRQHTCASPRSVPVSADSVLGRGERVMVTWFRSRHGPGEDRVMMGGAMGLVVQTQILAQGPKPYGLL